MKNFVELILFLSRFPDEFEVVVLSETFIVHDLDILKIEGYRTLYSGGELNRNDGVIVYIRETISCSYEIQLIGNIRILEVGAELQNYNITIAAIYRSPSTCPRQFNVNFENYIRRIKKGDIQIVVGDMNIDLPSSSDLSEEYKNIFSSNGFESYINKYTLLESKTCIDHFLVKASSYFDIESFIF